MPPTPVQVTSACQLFRNILRVHEKMPEKLRNMGNSFVRMEMRENMKRSTDAQFDMVLQKWREYYVMVSGQVNQGGKIGMKMSKQEKELLNSEQSGKLDALRSICKD